MLVHLLPVQPYHLLPPPHTLQIRKGKRQACCSARMGADTRAKGHTDTLLSALRAWSLKLCQARRSLDSSGSMSVPGTFTLFLRPLCPAATPSASQVVPERDDVHEPLHLQARRYGTVHDHVNRYGIVRVVLPNELVGVALVEVGADERRGVNVLPQACGCS